MTDEERKRLWRVLLLTAPISLALWIGIFEVARLVWRAFA